MSIPCNLRTNKEQQRFEIDLGVICEVSPFESGQGSGLAPDSTCLMDIPMHESLIEYRYHLEENLNTREVSCEMAGPNNHVDYRRGN